MLLQYYNGPYPHESSTNNQGKYQEKMSTSHPSPADALRYSTDSIEATIATNTQNDPMKLTAGNQDSHAACEKVTLGDGRSMWDLT